MSPAGLALAAATGMAAAFNPCGIGLLPSYLGFLLGRPARVGLARSALQGLVLGLAMTVGLLVLYVALAATFGLVAGAIGPHLPGIGRVVAVLLGLWGLLIIIWPDRFLLSVPVPASPGGPGARGVVGAAGYGLAFGLASLGCTFPLFVALVVQAGVGGGGAGGALAVGAYAAGMGLVLVTVAVVSRVLRAGFEARLRRALPLFGRLAGLAVLASGLYVLAYWAALVP